MTSGEHPKSWAQWADDARAEFDRVMSAGEDDEPTEAPPGMGGGGVAGVGE